jgi:hypothetical protein
VRSSSKCSEGLLRERAKREAKATGKRIGMEGKVMRGCGVGWWEHSDEDEIEDADRSKAIGERLKERCVVM